MNPSETDPTFEAEESGIVRTTAPLRSNSPARRRRIRGINCCSDLMEHRIVLSATLAAAFSMDAALVGGHESATARLRSEVYETSALVRTTQAPSEPLQRESLPEDFIGPLSPAENRGSYVGSEIGAASGAHSETVGVGPIARQEVFGPRALVKLLSVQEEVATSSVNLRADTVLPDSDVLLVGDHGAVTPNTATFRGTTSGFRVPGSADAIGILRSLALRNGRDDAISHLHQKPALTQREFADTSRSGRVTTITAPDPNGDSQKKPEPERRPQSAESSAAESDFAESDVAENDGSFVGEALSSPDYASRKPGVIRDRFASPRMVKHQKTVKYQDKVTQVRHEQPTSEVRAVHESGEHHVPGTKLTQSDFIEIEIRPGRQKIALAEHSDNSVTATKDRTQQKERTRRPIRSENATDISEYPASSESSLPQIRPQQAE